MKLYKATLLTFLACLSVSSTGALAQSAPPLRSVTIIRVQSSSGGTESVGASQTSTVNNHGGGNIQFTIREIGFGSNVIARMDGVVLRGSASTPNDVLICSTSGTPCRSGQTAIGADRYYAISGYDSGVFSYQATSINSPRNTYTDIISVR